MLCKHTTYQYLYILLPFATHHIHHHQSSYHTCIIIIHTYLTYIGVSWNAHSNVWRVFISVENKDMAIGTFQSEIEAAHAYDA